MAAATATLLASGGPSPSDPVRVTVNVPTGASDDVVVGGSDVDATDGFPVLIADEPVTFVLGPDDDLWGLSTAGSSINVLRTRQ